MKELARNAVDAFFNSLESSLKGKPLRLMAVMAAHEWALAEIDKLFA